MKINWKNIGIAAGIFLILLFGYLWGFVHGANEGYNVGWNEGIDKQTQNCVTAIRETAAECMNISGNILNKTLEENLK